MELNSQRGLVIFDIDGTLTRTQALDESLFQQAIYEVLGVKDICTDWGAYEHSTDEAIVAQVVRDQLGRTHSDSEIAAVRTRFVSLVGNLPLSAFAQVPGAQELLDALPGLGWRVAIASGGWSESACMKLRNAGFREVPSCGNGPWIPPTAVCGVPAAFAEDGWSRREIIRRAVERAAASGGPETRVIYVGDGRWDVISAGECGFGCVGVGSGTAADTLRSAGALAVVEDYRDSSEFTRALDRAARKEIG